VRLKLPKKPDKIKISFSTMPEITAINAPGINFNFFKKGTLSQAINILVTPLLLLTLIEYD
jgi:hypothetical protein